MTPETITQFVQNQFPAFYQESGPLFIEFARCYYEWLEQDGNELDQTRKFLDYHDVDKTSEDFLQFFKNKYLYNIPSEILVNPRFLIKHIKDVYQAKGSIRGWKLLFRLLFNQDVEIYLPSFDILAPSEGTYLKPTYLEVSNPRNIDLSEYVGKTIIGSSSGTRAVVENVFSSPSNQRIITQFYISNVIPTGGDFEVGELAVLSSNQGTSNSINSAIILGSPRSLTITSGGQDFSVGNIIEVVEKDPFTNEILTNGSGAKFRVTEVKDGQGSLYYQIYDPGAGYSYDVNVIQTNDPTDTTGSGGNFAIGPLTNIQYYSINTDALMNYANTPLNANTFNLPYFNNANVNTAIKDSLTYVTSPYGSITSLTNIETGNNYTKPVSVSVREGYTSKVLPGSVSWSTNTNIINLSNANFNNYFISNTVIKIASNTSANAELHIIVSVSNNQIITDSPITLANTTNGIYYASINPFVSQFPHASTLDVNGNILGQDCVITATPFVGSGIIANAISTDSGKGYISSENVKLYLYGAIQQPVIVSSGINYANGEYLTFVGGGTQLQANGSIVTNSNGSIVSIAMTSFGSSYVSIPSIGVNSRHGSGAVITTQLGTYNTYSAVFGEINLGGIGYGEGYWTSTKSFLNSDKYIQDSYFYQAYSYQLKVAVNLDKYSEILKSLYHPAGLEVFFARHEIMIETSVGEILDEYTTHLISGIDIGEFIIGESLIS